ncbi:hypothetical protein SELMODRAFT_402825 [Selaginella moellendorffii]|uniref:Uncharacterized protein n=1 Tax=Selaginella moellendorffii TaxID=88036 RepID=D8QN61_SELML|nr:hypothetical protein SELMODRAFT_402825 [Selaginella moellendorffii]
MNQSPAQTGLGWFGQHIWDHHQAADFKTHPTPLNSEFIVTFRHHDQMKHVWVEAVMQLMMSIFQDVLEGKWEDKPPSKDTQGANLVSFPEASNASSPPAKPRKKPRQPRIAMGVFPDKKSKEIYLGLQAKVPQNHNRHWARPLSERHQQAELWPKQKRKALELGREK